MNRLSIGTITFLVLATFAVSFAFTRYTPGGIESEALAGPASVIAAPGTTGMWTVDDSRRPGHDAAGPAAEFPEGPDTTGLLQEPLTIDELLALANADSGGDFEPVDRSAFAALLKSDPALRKAIAD